MPFSSEKEFKDYIIESYTNLKNNSYRGSEVILCEDRLEELTRSFFEDIKKYKRSPYHKIRGVAKYAYVSLVIKWLVSYRIFRVDNYKLEQNFLFAFIVFELLALMCETTKQKLKLDTILNSDKSEIKEMLEYHIRHRVNHEYSYLLFTTLLHSVLNS